MTIAVEDRLAIEELIKLHGHIVDQGAWDRLHEVFDPAAVLDLSAFWRGTASGPRCNPRCCLEARRQKSRRSSRDQHRVARGARRRNSCLKGLWGADGRDCGVGRLRRSHPFELGGVADPAPKDRAARGASAIRPGDRRKNAASRNRRRSACRYSTPPLSAPPCPSPPNRSAISPSSRVSR